MLNHLDLMYDQRSSLLDAIPTIGQAMLRLAGAFLTARDAASRWPLAADPRPGPSQGIPRFPDPHPPVWAAGPRHVSTLGFEDSLSKI